MPRASSWNVSVVRAIALGGTVAAGALAAGCMGVYAKMAPSPSSRATRVAPTGTFLLPPDAALTFASTAPNASPAVDASFSFLFDTFEPYEIVFALPAGFRFNGFDALGPAGTQIATYSLVTQAISYPIRVLGHDMAFVDILQTGSYVAASDGLIAYDNGVFRLTLPNGGDDLTLSVTAGFGQSVTFQLLAGILTNPATAGSYTVHADFTSVDPDSGGADDGTGTAPKTFSFDHAVAVACTSDAECDDQDPCTTDQCTAGACTNEPLERVAHFDCELGQLLAPELCAPATIDARFARALKTKVGAARKVVTKIRTASAKSRKRLVKRIQSTLRGLSRKAKAAKKLGASCQSTFAGLIDARIASAESLRAP
jgi:hypothetical protein